MELFAEGVEVNLAGGPGLADTTVEALGALAGLTEKFLALEEEGSDADPRAASYLAEARSNLVLAASALLASVDYKCTLATPPEDIRARPGPDGNMVHRCFHATPHCWDGTWKAISCTGA